MKKRTQRFLKSTFNAAIITGVLAGASKLSGKNLSKKMSLGVLIGAIGVQNLLVMPAYAFSQADVASYTKAMNGAANNQNIALISNLIDDDAIIALTRSGKTTSLNKEGYLQLLQKSWAKAKNYRYQIQVSDVVISGNQARAQANITETWTGQDGQLVTVRTSSRVTLIKSGENATLLRSVAQVTVD